MVVSYSFACTCNPFPPWGGPNSVLIWGFVLGLIITFYAVLGWHPWEACSFFPKRNGGRVDLGARRSGGKGNCLKCNVWEKNKINKLKIMGSSTSSMLGFWLVWSYVGFSLKKMRSWENLDRRTLKKPELLRQKRRMRKEREKTKMFKRVISWQEAVKKCPFMVNYCISPDWLQKHAWKKVEHSRHLVCPSKAKHISSIFIDI